MRNQNNLNAKSFSGQCVIFLFTVLAEKKNLRYYFLVYHIRKQKNPALENKLTTVLENKKPVW